MMGPCNSTQLGTPCLLVLASGDDYLKKNSGLFVESYIVDFGDVVDDIHLLFDEEDPSPVGARTHSGPLVHSLHD